MKLLKTDELDENELDKLYSFLMQSGNIINKFNMNNIIWSIIYLRKIFNKSYKSKKNNKERVKYNYIITNSDEMICFFTLHYIKKDNNISIADLTLILKNKEHLEKIFNIIQSEFQELSSIMSNINLLSIYIPNTELALVQNISNNTDFELGFLDNTTYKEECNVYYNLYINDNLVSDKQHDKYHDKYHAYSKGQIIELLMNQYGVNTIVNPKREISAKLTRKSIAVPEIKIVTKNIFDIKEIQDLPEYDYDFNKMYLIMDIYSLIYYIFNKRNNITENIIMERFFPENTIYFNKKLYDIYFNIYTRYYAVLSSFKIKDIFFNNLVNIINNYKLPFSRYIGDNLKIITHFKPNRLILTGSRTEIEYFSNYKCDIINIKNQIKNYEIFKERKKKYPNIINAFNFNELKDAFTNLKNRYDNIYINSLYINYDYHIKSIHLYIKLPYISYLLLSSLDSLNNNGSMILRFIDGNKIDIPFFKKIIGIIVNLFDSYEIHDYTDLFYIIIEFKKFNVNKYKTNKNIIQRLLKEIHKYEHIEYNLDNAMTCLLTNKFYYKIESELIEKYKINMRLKHILYDFNVIDNDINFFNNKTKQFVIEFNNLIDNKINILNKIYNDIYKYENNKIIFTNKIIKYLLYRIINIFKIYRDNDLFNSLDLDLFLEKFNKQYKNIYEYMDINIKN
jgi:hypothetical protein